MQRKTALGFGALLCMVVASLPACFNSYNDCDGNPILRCGKWAPQASTGGGGGGGGGAGAGGAGGGNGGGGGVVGNCDPLSGSVDEGCGVFASSSVGAAGNSGSKEKPLASLAEALAAAPEGGKVYACGEAFAEAVVVDKAVTIYGGLDCTGGGWNALAETRTTIAAPSDVVGMRVEAAANGALIQDVEVRAADATVAGGSSIAVLVDGAQVTFERCAMIAGNGAAGVDGTDAPAVAATAGPGGNSGGSACSNAVQVNGALPTNNDCGGVFSVGGGGGNGNIVSGGDGSKGQPDMGFGQAGTGEPSVGAWTCVATGGGQPGADGTPGTPGVGATSPGSLGSVGYTGTTGMAGTGGTPAQGGGGGGGAKGKAGCGGASGGAGGAGGCGGAPGEGAGPGGASFALVSLNASLTLNACTLTAGNGGAGGSGGDAQSGGSGGVGGVGGNNNGDATLKNACSGGNGGQGGSGGPGGGGLGGPSAAIAHVGAAPEFPTSTLTAGMGGLGGLGGNGNALGNAGADGGSMEVLAF